MSSRPNLTEKQAAIYAMVVQGEADGVVPTMREMADATGVSKTTVFERVDRLIDKGYLTRNRRMRRSLSAVEPIDGRYAFVAGNADDLAKALRAVLMLPVDQGMNCMVIQESSDVLKQAHASLSAYDAAKK